MIFVVFSAVYSNTRQRGLSMTAVIPAGTTDFVPRTRLTS